MTLIQTPHIVAANAPPAGTNYVLCGGNGYCPGKPGV
jgi:hypothetical protein